MEAAVVREGPGHGERECEARVRPEIAVPFAIGRPGTPEVTVCAMASRSVQINVSPRGTWRTFGSKHDPIADTEFPTGMGGATKGVPEGRTIGLRMPSGSIIAGRLAQPPHDGSVLEPRGVELRGPDDQDRYAKHIAIPDARWPGRDVDALYLERALEPDPPQRAVRLGAEVAVGLLQEAHAHRRPAMRPPAHEREGAPQIPTSHRASFSP